MQYWAAPTPDAAWRMRFSSSSLFWASMPLCQSISSGREFPTIDDSFCRSLCKPRPLAARCSRITAVPRFVPLEPPSSVGSASRNRPAASARRRISASSSSQSLAGDTSTLEVGASPLTPMVEEAMSSSLVLERSDLGLDELVDPVGDRSDVGGDVEIHRRPQTRPRDARAS